MGLVAGFPQESQAGSAPVNSEDPWLSCCFPYVFRFSQPSEVFSLCLFIEAIMSVAWDHTTLSSLCSGEHAKAKVTCLLRAGPATYPG